MVSKAVLVRITGRVQGVGFRAWTVRQAEALGLAGWVRNEADGSVSSLVFGPVTQVDDMVARLKRGPAGAHVHEVKLSSADAADAPRPFEARY